MKRVIKDTLSRKFTVSPKKLKFTAKNFQSALLNRNAEVSVGYIRDIQLKDLLWLIKKN